MDGLWAIARSKSLYRYDGETWSEAQTSTAGSTFYTLADGVWAENTAMTAAMILDELETPTAASRGQTENPEGHCHGPDGT